MINPTFNLSTVTDFARITTATICTERVTLERAPDDVRAEFMGCISDAVWNAGWSLAGLKGKARQYKGSYYRTLQRNLIKYLSTTGREVGFAYDATKGGTKRPWTRIDGSPMWLD